MELIKELNTNLAILADELNRKVINFSENCLYFGTNSIEACDKGIKFLESLSEYIKNDTLEESSIPSTLNGLVVLDLMKVKQKHPEKINESMSIRKYIKEDKSSDDTLVEQLGRLVNDHGENAQTLKEYYKEVLNVGKLSDVVKEMIDEYKLIRTKL